MARNNSEKKNKHLTLEDRKEIEGCLDKQMSYKDIGKLIEKDSTTISYEVKHHRQEHRNGLTTFDEPCQLLLKPPFVCNGCKKRYVCRYVHYYYRASLAQNEYKNTLSESREGTPLNHEEFYKTDAIISGGLAAGQHIYHIMANNPEIKCSKSTVYRHLNKGYYTALRLDLPRAVKFKARKKKPNPYVPKGVKKGRSYEDFLSYIDENHLDYHVELDTVIGREGGKVILTILFTSCNFMIGLLLDNRTAPEASSHFQKFKNTLRSEGIPIKNLMPVFLADNGGEFSNVFAFENDPNDKKEVPLFFCDPMRSSEKPFIEKNHTLFRDIAPKGSSFDDFTQETVNLIFSHVNSVSRLIYNGKTAYEMFSFLYGDNIAPLLGISKILPADVVQSPKLLKGVDLMKNIG